MGYVGNQTSNSYSSMDKQTITGNGGASYTLTHAVANAQEIEVFVNNVRQEAGVAYTVSGTALTMTGNVASTDDFYVIYQGKALQTVVPPDGSVSTAKLGNGAVTKAKMGTTELDLATIKDSTGTNTGMTIDSSGLVSLPNSVYVTRFELSANQTSNAVITNWANMRLAKQVSSVGTAVTVSSGIFTFPVTGVWKITIQARILSASGDSTAGLYLNATTDNSTYTNYVFASEGDSAGTSTGGIFVQDILNVDDTTNVKVQIEATSLASGSQIYGASTGSVRTWCSFERIADAQ